MTNPPGAMPPLPDNAGWQPSIGQYVYTAEQLQAYAAPLIARVAELQAALRFYADVSDYKAPFTGGAGKLWLDCGETARAALTPTKD